MGKKYGHLKTHDVYPAFSGPSTMPAVLCAETNILSSTRIEDLEWKGGDNYFLKQIFSQSLNV